MTTRARTKVFALLAVAVLAVAMPAAVSGGARVFRIRLRR